MNVTWSTPAGRDLHRLAIPYRIIDPDLSAEMRRRVDIAAGTLGRLGNVGAPLPDGRTFKKRVQGTPFLLFFIVEEGGIYVERVRHFAENWSKDY